MIGIVAAVVLCYHYGYGLQGMWYGWNLGILVNCLWALYYLKGKYKEFLVRERRDRGMGREKEVDNGSWEGAKK